MKTLYYKMELRVQGEFYNEGFIYAIMNDKKRLEYILGVFTNDFLEAYPDEDGELQAVYYKCSELDYVELFFLEFKERIVLPYDGQIELNNGKIVLVETKERIYNEEQQQQYLEVIKKYQKMFSFG